MGSEGPWEVFAFINMVKVIAAETRNVHMTFNIRSFSAHADQTAHVSGSMSGLKSIQLLHNMADETCRQPLLSPGIECNRAFPMEVNDNQPVHHNSRACVSHSPHAEWPTASATFS